MAKAPRKPKAKATPEEETVIGYIPGIPDTPENVARAISQGPLKKDWDYLKRPRRARKPGEGEDA